MVVLVNKIDVAPDLENQMQPLRNPKALVILFAEGLDA